MTFELPHVIARKIEAAYGIIAPISSPTPTPTPNSRTYYPHTPTLVRKPAGLFPSL